MHVLAVIAFGLKGCHGNGPMTYSSGHHIYLLEGRIDSGQTPRGQDTQNKQNYLMFSHGPDSGPRTAS